LLVFRLKLLDLIAKHLFLVVRQLQLLLQIAVLLFELANLDKMLVLLLFYVFDLGRIRKLVAAALDDFDELVLLYFLSQDFIIEHLDFLILVVCFLKEQSIILLKLSLLLPELV